MENEKCLKAPTSKTLDVRFFLHGFDPYWLAANLGLASQIWCGTANHSPSYVVSLSGRGLFFFTRRNERGITPVEQLLFRSTQRGR